MYQFIKRMGCAVFALVALLQFLPSFALATQPERTLYYATEELNVRSGPGMGYGIVGELDENEQVTLLSINGKWGEISYKGGRKGYAFLAYLEPVNSACYATTGLNLRSGPGTKYAIVGGLEPGDKVVRLGRSGSWSLVLHEGKRAYAYSKYLSSSAPSQSPSNPYGFKFATLERGAALYADSSKKQQLYYMQSYGGSQRVPILDDMGDTKKIAVYGYELYVDDSALTSISSTYSAGRDAAAIRNYNMAVNGAAYRKQFEDYNGYGGFGYDPSTNTCILYFRRGAAPGTALESGFKVNSCQYSLDDLKDAENRIHALAKQYGWKNGKDYTVSTTYQRVSGKQPVFLQVDVLFIKPVEYSRFEQALKSRLDESVYWLSLMMD